MGFPNQSNKITLDLNHLGTKFDNYFISFREFRIKSILLELSKLNIDVYSNWSFNYLKIISYYLRLAIVAYKIIVEMLIDDCLIKLS